MSEVLKGYRHCDVIPNLLTSVVVINGFLPFLLTSYDSRCISDSNCLPAISVFSVFEFQNASLTFSVS